MLDQDRWFKSVVQIPASNLVPRTFEPKYGFAQQIKGKYTEIYWMLRVVLLPQEQMKQPV